MIRLAGASSKAQFISEPFSWPNVSGSTYTDRYITHNLGTHKVKVRIFQSFKSGGYHLVPTIDRGIETEPFRYGYLLYTDDNQILLRLYRNLQTGGGSGDTYIAYITEL